MHIVDSKELSESCVLQDLIVTSHPARYLAPIPLLGVTHRKKSEPRSTTALSPPRTPYLHHSPAADKIYFCLYTTS